MKWSRLLREVVFAIGLLTATLARTVAAQAPPAGDSLRLKVDGMVCSLCAYGVERRLRTLAQVNQVRVNLDSGLVLVLLRPGAVINDSVLAREVRRAGFALRALERFARGSPSVKPGGAR